MHHPLLFLLGLFMMARLFARVRRRGMAFLGCGGGCHGRHFRLFGRRRWRHVPVDLGAPDEEWHARQHMRRASRWAQRWEHGQRVTAPVPAAPPVTDLSRSLDLNARQRALFEDIVAKANGSVAKSVLAQALAEVAREPFAIEDVEVLDGRGDLADDLLQLHHSLTPEQRARLREATGA